MKRFTIIAGPNGCGKTGVYEHLRSRCLDLGYRVNPDEIAKEKNISDIEAGKIALRRVNEYIDSGKTFHQETTLSAVGFEKHVIKAVRNNFEIQMYYVIVSDPEIAHQRAEHGRLIRKDRTQTVDKNTLMTRYFKSQKRFVSVFKRCDYVEVFDNTSILKLIWIYNKGKFIIPDAEELRKSVTNELLKAVSAVQIVSTKA